MRELLQPANLDIILRTVTMAALVTLACGGHRLPDRLLRRALCPRRMQGAVLSRGDDAAVVELSGQGLCLEADPGQGRHPHLARQATCICPGCSTPSWRCRSSAARRCRSAIIGTFLVFVYIWLPFMILPIQAALERVPANLHRGLGRSRRHARPDLPQR